MLRAETCQSDRELVEGVCRSLRRRNRRTGVLLFLGTLTIAVGVGAAWRVSSRELKAVGSIIAVEHAIRKRELLGRDPRLQPLTAQQIDSQQAFAVRLNRWYFQTGLGTGAGAAAAVAVGLFLFTSAVAGIVRTRQQELLVRYFDRLDALGELDHEAGTKRQNS